MCVGILPTSILKIRRSGARCWRSFAETFRQEEPKGVTDPVELGELVRRTVEDGDVRECAGEMGVLLEAPHHGLGITHLPLRAGHRLNLHGHGCVFELVQDGPFDVTDDAVHRVTSRGGVTVRMVEQPDEHGLVAHDERGGSPDAVGAHELGVFLFHGLQGSSCLHVGECGVRVPAVRCDDAREGRLVTQVAAAVVTVLEEIVMEAEERGGLVVAQVLMARRAPELSGRRRLWASWDRV